MSEPQNLSGWHSRPATEEDLDALVTIEAASFETPWSAASLKSELTRDPSCVYLATMREDPIAYVVFQRLLDECELLRLAVVPQYRRQRIGQRMLHQGLQSLHRHGCRRCHLEVREDNAPARRLYENFGFEVAGRRKGYYRQQGAPIDAVLYSLALDSQSFGEGA